MKTPNPAPPAFGGDKWNALLEQSIQQIKSLSSTKGAEYTGGVDDRLDNFRRAGAKWGVPMEIVWGIYFGKHLDAIETYVNDLRNGVTRTRSEPITGRVDDAIVYLLLFKAMVVERGNA